MGRQDRKQNDEVKLSKILRFGSIGLGIVLVIIQLVPNELPPVEPRPATDLLASGDVPEAVASMLKTSCYDCHSVESTYPWYSRVAPSSWLVASDVREAREELNLSEWKNLPKRKKIKNLENIKDEVGEGHMPMPIYLVLHWDAKLTDEQRKQIVDWANAYQDQILSEPEPEEEEDEDSDDES